MQSIVVDAGPLIALFKPSDRHHKAATAFLGWSESATLVTNLLVVGEVSANPGFKEAIEDMQESLVGFELEKRRVISGAASFH